MNWQPLRLPPTKELASKVLENVSISELQVTGTPGGDFNIRNGISNNDTNLTTLSSVSGSHWYGIMGNMESSYCLPQQSDLMNSLLNINPAGPQALPTNELFSHQAVNGLPIGVPRIVSTASCDMNNGQNLLTLLRLQQQQVDESLLSKEIVSQKEENSLGLEVAKLPSTSPGSHLKSFAAKKRGDVPATGPCSVCEASNAAFHFGTLACAACSAFFRRTVAEQRKYTCSKRGAEHMNCPIDRNHRCYCRACRLQKCLAQGMDPAAVQPHRDSIGAKRKSDGEPTDSKRKKLNNTEHFQTEEGSTVSDSSFVAQQNASTNAALFNVNLAVAEQLMALSRSVPYVNRGETGIKVEPHEVEDVRVCSAPKERNAETSQDAHWKDSAAINYENNTTPSSVDSAERPSSCLSNAATTSGSFNYISHQNMIENMVEQYRKMLERRRVVYCPCTIRDIIGGTQPIARPAKAMPQVRRDNIRVEIGLYVEFLNTIHPFPKFSVDDKICLLKHLSVSFTILDKYYNTMRAGGLQTNRIVHSDGTYTDLNNPDYVEFVLGGSEGNKPSMDKETFDKLFLQPLRDTLNELSRPMYHAGTTDTEFCALLAVLLFDPAAPGLCDSTRRIVKDARDKVYRDWFAYYRAHGVVHTDASEKVGNTLLLLPAIQCAVERTAENYHLNRVFEIFDYDQILDEVFSSGDREMEHNICVNGSS